MHAPVSVSCVDQSADCAFALSRQNRVVAWNSAAAAILGWTAREIVGQDATELLEMKDLFGNRWCSHHCGLHEMVRRDEAIQTLCLFVRAKDGKYHQFFGSVDVVDSGPGRQEGSREWDLVFRLQRERRRQTAGALIERLLRRDMASPSSSRSGGREALPLTARQKEVLSLLADGFEPPRIAKRLGVSVNTVRNHIQRILVTLDCHSQANAVAIAIRQGMI